MALTSCCKCFSLKTGTIIIGVWCMISAIPAIIMALGAVNKIENYQDFDNNRMVHIVGRAVILSIIAYLIIVLLLAVMLIVGACNRKANLIFPYLSLEFTSIIVSIAASVGFIAIVICTANVMALDILMMTIVIASSIAFKIYLWFVIHYFYQVLLSEKFGREINPETGKVLREPFEYDV